MSLRSAIARATRASAGAPLQPEYVSRVADAVGRNAEFRVAVPVLRVRSVEATVAWYRAHLGFDAEVFPARGPAELAILERDGVQLLARRAQDERPADGHTGWDLYLWVDGADLDRLEASLAHAGALARPVSPMSDSIAELECRDPDGYVLCIGGPTSSRSGFTRS